MIDLEEHKGVSITRQWLVVESNTVLHMGHEKSDTKSRWCTGMLRGKADKADARL